MKIDAGSKVKTARTWLCFQRPCALVVSELRVTMRITRKCPAVRFALFTTEMVNKRRCNDFICASLSLLIILVSEYYYVPIRKINLCC